MASKPFPKVIQDRFSKAIFAHSLQREIKATALVNNFINRLEHTLLGDIKKYKAVEMKISSRLIFLFMKWLIYNNYGKNTEALDPLLISDVQYKAFIEINEMLQDACIWYLRQSTEGRVSLLNGHLCLLFDISVNT